MTEKPRWANGACVIDRGELERIQQCMLTQDNRATAYPIFEVRDVEQLYGVDPKFQGKAVRVLLIDQGGGDAPVVIEVDADGAGNKLLEYIRGLAESYEMEAEDIIVRTNDDVEMNIAALDPLDYPADDIYGVVAFLSRDGEQLSTATGTGRLAVPRTVKIFFTEEGAHNYIARNRHNLDSPHTYASSAWDVSEIRAVMEMLAVADMQSIQVNEADKPRTPKP